MSEKKRKRSSEAVKEIAHKKAARDSSSDIVKVSVIDDEKQWQPILASSPGLIFPESNNFKTYKNDQSNPTNLLLHSEAHPTLDYIAREEDSNNGAPSLLAHYIGVYDTRRQRLKLIPARTMTIRSSLISSRQKIAPESGDDEDPNPPPSISSRSALGLAFGTKKSQKRIKEMTSNAIGSSKPLSEDRVASAVISSMPTETTSKESLQFEVDAARAAPRANKEATTPAEVYTIASLVGGEDVLAKIKVKDWMDAIKAGGDVRTVSMFISQRIMPLCNRGDVKMVRVLRYTYLMILWYKSLRPPKGNKGNKRVPKLEVSSTDKSGPALFTKELVTGFDKDVLHALDARFSDKGTLTRWHEDRLITHVLALTFWVDNFETDTHNIQYDLGLAAKDATKYYKELGSECRAFSKREYDKMGIGAMEASQRKIARLKLPLKFPQARGVRGARK